MADIMNHLTLAQETTIHSEEINTEEVLREYGLAHATQISTVIHQEDGSNVVIPEGNSLVPPPITSDTVDSTQSNNSRIDEELDALANEMLGVLSDTESPLDQDSGMPPVSPDDEEDEDFNLLLRTGVLSEATVPDTAANITDTVIPTESNENTPLDTSVPEVPQETATEDPASTPVSIEEIIDGLPTNSLSYTHDDTTSRFSGAAWYNAVQQSTVLLAGLGGIGSYILFCLSRMKPRQIFIYDDDIVEAANLSGQLYSSNMIGKRKVDAMTDLARDFSLYYGVQAIPQRFTKDTAAGDIMICGFDNMQARKDFFNAWVTHVSNHKHPEKCLFIDGRLAMEEFQVFCIRGDDTYNIKRYNKEYLFEEYMAQSIVCSMKQTTYCANMIGSVIVNLFTNFIANQLKPLVDRDLPFKTYYDAGMMFFKTEV